MAGSEHEAVGGADDRVAITAGGVHVNKWVAEGGSSVPIIKYELASTRDDDVRVALTDRIPEHLGLDDFGFHDEFHGESWNHVDDHEIRFETELGAEETLTTVYGVRRDAISDPDEFLGRPEISISASTNSSGAAGSAADDGADGTDDDEGAGSADSEASGDGRSDDAGVPTLSLPDPSSEQYDGEDGVDGALVEAGGDADGGSVLDLDDSDAEDSGGTSPDDDPKDDDGTDSEPEPTAFKQEDASTDADNADDATDADDTDGDAPAEDSTAAGASPDDLVERLVAALQSDELDAETRSALGRELNLQLSASSSQFVEHLQSRMKEKRGQLETDIENIEDSIAELYGVKADESTVATVRNEKADRETVEDVSDAVDALEDGKADESSVAAVRDDLDALEDEAATEDVLETTEESLRDDISTVADELEGLDDRAATEDDLEATETALEDDVAAVGDDLDALDERTPSEEAFESLRADHDELAEDAARQSDVVDVRAELEETDSALSTTIADRASELEARVDEDVESLEATLSELDAEKAQNEALAETDDRLDALADESATVDDLESVESGLESVRDDLEARYVTEADITDALESRLQRSMFARTLLLGAGTAIGGGTALVATAVTGGIVLVVVGLAALGYWWWLNDTELDGSTPLRTAGDDADADENDAATGDSPPTDD